MIDYETTKYSQLVELAASGDLEAEKYKKRIDDFIAREKRYCEYAMMGTRANYDPGERRTRRDNNKPIVLPTTLRGLGRRMLMFTVSPRMIFRKAEKRFSIENYLYNNFEDEIRPDWMDLIAPAYYTVLTNPAIIGNLTDIAKFMDGLRISKQKRRGLIHAAVGREIERSLFGGRTSNQRWFKLEIPETKYEKELAQEYAEHPIRKKMDELFQTVEYRSAVEKWRLMDDVWEAMNTLKIPPEDRELLYTEHGDIERIAKERGVKPGTLRQIRKRWIDKLKEKLL